MKEFECEPQLLLRSIMSAKISALLATEAFESAESSDGIDDQLRFRRPSNPSRSSSSAFAADEEDEDPAPVGGGGGPGAGGGGFLMAISGTPKCAQGFSPAISPYLARSSAVNGSSARCREPRASHEMEISIIRS